MIRYFNRIALTFFRKIKQVIIIAIIIRLLCNKSFEKINNIKIINK